MGKIHLKIRTNRFGGKLLSDTIIIYTNDPKHEKTAIRISGNVEAFAESDIPSALAIEGVLGQKIESRIRIIPNRKYPFSVISVSADDGEYLRFRSEQQSEGYVLIIENILDIPGLFWDTIHIRTDSPAKPEIVIPVKGKVVPSEHDR
jgi:hypothetical protein